MTDTDNILHATKTASFDIDAKPVEDVRFDGKKAEEVLEHYHDVKSVQVEKITDNERKVLENWLGASFLSHLREVDATMIYRSLMRIPQPVEQNSFVWDVITDAASIKYTMKAISEVKKFGDKTFIVSDQIGANNEFRTLMEKYDTSTSEVTLRQLIDKLGENVNGLDKFVNHVQYLRERAQTVFVVDDFSVEAMLVVFAASHAIVASEHYINDIVTISKLPQGSNLNRLQIVRSEVIDASNKVKKICGVAPVLFSEALLAGVIRSVEYMRKNDFVYAIESLGGHLEGEDDIQEAIDSFMTYIAAYKMMKDEIISWGYSEDEIAPLISYALIQNHFMAAAQELNIDFDRIEVFLRLATPEDRTEIGLKSYRNHMMQFFKEMAKDGVSGRLIAVCENKEVQLSEVHDVIYKAVIDRKYFLQAGNRILEIYADITLNEIKEIIGQEVELRTANQIMSKLGVNDKDDLITLERHVKWAKAVNALPVPSEAILKLIKSHGALQPKHV